MIKRSELSNLRRLASGPYSGEVFAADWMKPDGQKVNCIKLYKLVQTRDRHQ